MGINEQFEVINGIQIKFKYKKRKYDTKHLIFVFSGFGGNRGITYDFENVLEHCPANIIWIKDSFKDACAYYWCVDMDFSYENAVSQFIENKLKELDIPKSNCTVAGFSKGGSAALYYGIKHNIQNIVLTVPQIYVGSYISANWARIAKHMMGERLTEKNIILLDNKILEILDSDKMTNKNIYLISSEKDIQYSTEIQPNVEKFAKYSNFNLLMAKSLLVNEHKQVTPYHVPLLLGIFYSLAQGAVPHYGNCDLVADNKKAEIPTTAKPVAILKKFSFKEHIFYPEGLAFMKDVPCEQFRDIRTKLVIKNQDNIFYFDLAKDHKPNLTKDLYDGAYVNYDKAWFCTFKYAGLDFKDILFSKGVYSLNVYIETKYYNKEIALLVNKKFENSVLDENENFKLFTKNKQAYLEIK